MTATSGALLNRLTASSLTFLSLLGLLLISGCEKEVTEQVEVIRPVKTMVVEAPILDRSRMFPGKVAASEEVDLAFQVSGALTQLPVRQGQDVEKGTVLAQLDTRDYRSDLKAAQAESARARADYKRAAEIFKRRLISEADVDRLRAARDVAAANLEKARKAVKDTTLRAPFDGVIATLYVDNFQDIQAKQAVLSLQDNSSLDISVQVPENIIVRAGRARDEVDLVAIIESIPDREFPLAVREFSTQADPDTQTFEFILSMPAPEDINVLPGMSVSVKVTPKEGIVSTGLDEPLIRIPATAVFAATSGEATQYVWIFENQQVQQREVTIGRLLGSETEIINGLSPGERIVTAGVHYLQPGQKVRLFEGRVGAN